MRELKFRAWHETDKCWYNPRFIEMNLLGQAIIHHGLEQFEIVPASAIEQYTGLKDKNGREIYEGDIVTDALGKKHTVEWDDEEVRYYFQPVGSTYYHDRVAPETTDYSTMEGRWSVIGNIHENPELLGGEE